MQTLGVTTCYAVSDTAMADPNFVSSHGLCTVAGTCF
jgi:NADH:ubiquinone oxidoreductase subunit B-like Fe-S oxidoreductase